MSEASEVGENRPPRGLHPGMVIEGVISPPGSKSLAIRSLLAAGLARGRTRLVGCGPAEDVRAAIEVLISAGLEVEESEDGALEVLGALPWRPGAPLRCGESGTVARLVTALAALACEAGERTTVDVRGSLLSRSSTALVECLRRAGARLEPAQGADTWPVIVQGVPPPDELVLSQPASSQELSGLLLALAAHAGRRQVVVEGALPSRPYVEMTIHVLERFGARVEQHAKCWSVRGPMVAPREELAIEPDASAAAVALAAGCLSGGSVRVAGFAEDSTQGDLVIVEYLRAFGCDAERRSGALFASGLPSRCADLDLSSAPDLAPVLVAMAAAHALRVGAQAPSSRLRGLETLNGKECRRVEVLAAGLRALGVDVIETEESLEIGGARPTDGSLVLDPHGDHRMAFAFALLGLVRVGLSVSSPACVAKSWPDFWEVLGA